MLSITHGDKEYNLKLTLAGVRSAEAQGLDMEGITKQPYRGVTLLVYAALYGEYKLSLAKVEGILDSVLEAEPTKFTELFGGLYESYTKLFGLGESTTE